MTQTPVTGNVTLVTRTGMIISILLLLNVAMHYELKQGPHKQVSHANILLPHSD